MHIPFLGLGWVSSKPLLQSFKIPHEGEARFKPESVMHAVRFFIFLVGVFSDFFRNVRAGCLSVVILEKCVRNDKHKNILKLL